MATFRISLLHSTEYQHLIEILQQIKVLFISYHIPNFSICQRDIFPYYFAHVYFLPFTFSRNFSSRLNFTVMVFIATTTWLENIANCFVTIKMAIKVSKYFSYVSKVVARQQPKTCWKYTVAWI